LKAFKIAFGLTLTELCRLEYHFTEKYNFPEANIYNGDEAEVSTVQKSGSILEPNGEKQDESDISWERGRKILLYASLLSMGILF
jgi:hypothetical protein